MSEYRRKLMLAYAANKRSDNIIYPGLIAAWSAKGKTNDDADRATLRDLTGNGHDITLNGFAFSEMSGYGGYFIKKAKWTNTNRCEEFINDGYILIFKNIIEEGNLCFINTGAFSTEGNKVKVKITGIPEEGLVIFGASRYIIANEDGIHEGIYTLDLNGNTTINVVNSIGSTITVEFLPEYPDSLVFDGTDDRGVCNNMPILEDYTLIVKRNTFISDDSAKWTTVACFGNNTSNVYELVNNVSARVYIDGYLNGKIYNAYTKDGISFTTKSLYNGLITLSKGETPTDKNNFYIGALNGNTYYFNGAFYEAYLFDKSLDKEEVELFILKYIDSDYVLPSEQTT